MIGLIDLVQGSPPLWYCLVGLISLLVGSFLNVAIHRLPIMMERAWREGLEEIAAQDAADATNTAAHAAADGTPDCTSDSTSDSAAEPFNLSVPRSRCPHCGHAITALENVPILSWLVLRGRCAGCGVRISARYPLVEAVTALLSLLVAWHFGPTPQALLGILVTWFLITMSMIDVDTQFLFDNLTLPLLWIGLLASLIPIFADVRAAVIGAAAGYLVLWTVYQVFRLVTGKEGMGYGDFKLLAAIGALLGWQALPLVILLSSLVGAIVGIALIAVTGRDKGVPMPFGPFLAAAGFIAMLWGDGMIEGYYRLFA